MSINTDDSRLADARLLTDVLMAMKEQSWLSATNIARKRLEGQMNFVLSVVDVSWRIVGDKHINPWECGNRIFDLILVIKKVAARLVSPRTTETAKGQIAKTFDPKMHVK
jgi:hypothetical protein